jgi:hypothetical protein
MAEYTLAEVRAHNQPNDLWMAIHGKVRVRHAKSRWHARVVLTDRAPSITCIGVRCHAVS